MQLKLTKLFFKKTVLIALIFFLILIGLIAFISPEENKIALIPFFISAAGLLFFISVSILKNKRRALLITIAILLVFILRYFDLRNFLYPVLISAIYIALAIYFRQKSPKRRL